MADISSVVVDGVTYLVKDAEARKDIEDIKKNGGGGSGGGTGGASSWEDLGEKTGTIEVLPETTWTTPSGEFPGKFLPEVSVIIELDKTYTVNWNGKEYTTVPYLNESSGLIALGNPSYVGGTGTQEPYGIVIENGIITEAYDADLASKVTVSIITVGTTIYPIPGKYLPKGTPWVEGGMKIIFPETTGEFSTGAVTGLGEVMLASALDLVVGETYIVTWDGKEYECVCKHLAGYNGGVYMESDVLGNAVIFGDINTGEPFIIGNVIQPMSVSLAVSIFDNKTHSFDIYQDNANVHKLDNRCLDLAWLPILNQNSFLNNVICTFSGSWASNGMGAVKYYRSVLFPELGSLPLVEDNRYTVIWDDIEYELVASLWDGVFVLGNLLPLEGNAYDTGEPFTIVTGQIEGFGFLQVYEIDEEELDIQTHILSVIENAARANKLPAEFLPDAMIVNVNFSTMTADKTCDEIWGAIKNKRDVFLLDNSTNIPKYMRCVYCAPHEIACFIGFKAEYENDLVTSIGAMTIVGVTEEGTVVLKI